MAQKLTPTSILMLAALAAVAGVTCFVLFALLIRSGASPVGVHGLLFLAPIGVGILVAWQAWLVRAYKLGKRAMDPVHAARIWVLTQATSRAGALLCGGAAGISVAYWLGGPTAYLTEQAINAGLAAFGALVMTVAGLIGERWCMVDDDGQPETTQAAGA
ncbi:DUF3180 domain-containing protein [Trueperella bialowiezensis]|uniref:Protein of uncharacterized function (DUF3180) n=1 Tax=Trueperella bialowiezensis TaxID=312285 RepID=A0A448PFG0_9ACTO|nr:DUF3180 domain-containing protein [Trueperella bialowiezensis]VEI13657.1 Protein of uncharacterised function (DUF3180) [Trueperella bialowiezensis]